MESNEIHIHKFTDTVIPSTCKECGYTLHKCDCGYEYKDSEEMLNNFIFQYDEVTQTTILYDSEYDKTESSKYTYKYEYDEYGRILQS